MIRSIIIFFFLLLPSLVFAETVNKIVVFGDSLSDTGNLYSMTSENHKKIFIFPVIPKSPPYFEGRFSNGLVWIETLAKKMNITALENYAYGGAWAESYRDSDQLFPFDLNMQVSAYLFKNPFDLSRDKNLFVIWIGGNDYLAGRSNLEKATRLTVAMIKKQIETLIYYGGNRFLILNLPDLGLTPNAISQGPDFAMAQSKISDAHNNKLAKMISDLKIKHPDTNLLMLDVTEKFKDVTSNPVKYNLKEVTKPCYTAENTQALKAANKVHLNIANNTSLKVAAAPLAVEEKMDNVCINQDDYLYWDLVHPTRVGHAIIADFAFQALQLNGLT